MSSFTSQATNPFALAEQYWQISFTTDKAAAHQAEAYFNDVALSTSVFEVDEAAGIWKVDVVTDVDLDDEEVNRRLGLLVNATGSKLPDYERIDVSPDMWQHNLHEFPPLSIGSYLIHGSHIAPDNIGGITPICVDAGMAFGSGEHATTEGCLQLFDQYLKQRRYGRAIQKPSSLPCAGISSAMKDRSVMPEIPLQGRDDDTSGRVHILDMGCGSAILAMAAAKQLPGSSVVAVDIDKVSVTVAKENAKLNGVDKQVKLYLGDGYQSRAVKLSAPYDIVFANILARPLMRMAVDLSRVLHPEGVAIISGLLVSQEAMVLAAHRLVGLHLRARWHKEGWSALILEKQ